MQPEVKTDQIKFAPQPEKHKENLVPVVQWDHLAFSVIQRELAPKGYKVFKNGHWRGAEHANIPFLSKKVGCLKLKR